MNVKGSEDEIRCNDTKEGPNVIVGRYIEDREDRVWYEVGGILSVPPKGLSLVSEGTIYRELPKK